MQKNKVLKIALGLIFPILFNISFYMFGGFKHNASVWISYAFIHFSWILLIITPFLSPSDASRSIFNLSTYSISLIYFFSELVVGTIIIVIHPQTIKLPIFIQIILLAVYAAVLIPVMLANEHSAENTERIQRAREDIQDLCSRVITLSNIIPDGQLKRELQRTYNTLHAMPVAKAQHSDRILNELRQLEFSVHESNTEEAILICKRIQEMAR